MGIVETQSIALVVEGLAGAVVGIFTALVNMRVGVAVQDGYRQVALERGSRTSGMSATQRVVAEPTCGLKKSILAGGSVGLNRCQVSALDQSDGLAAVKARKFITAPNNITKLD